MPSILQLLKLRPEHEAFTTDNKQCMDYEEQAEKSVCLPELLCLGQTQQ